MAVVKSPKNNKNKKNWIKHFSKYRNSNSHSRIGYLTKFRQYDNPYLKHYSCEVIECNHIRYYKSGLDYLVSIYVTYKI